MQAGTGSWSDMLVPRGGNCPSKAFQRVEQCLLSNPTRRRTPEQGASENLASSKRRDAAIFILLHCPLHCAYSTPRAESCAYFDCTILCIPCTVPCTVHILLLVQCHVHTLIATSSAYLALSHALCIFYSLCIL